MNDRIIKQMADEYRWLPYPTSASNFGDNGCGCCACVHTAMEQESKKDWDVEDLRQWMIDQGFAVPGHGTEWEGIVATLEHIGHKEVVWIKKKDPMSMAWEELDKGNRIGVLLVDNGDTPDGTYWTSSGHYVSFNKYWKDSNGNHWFNIKDSGTRGHDGEFCYEKSLKGALPQLYIVERIGDEPEPTPDDGRYHGAYPVVQRYLEPGDRGVQVTRLQNYLDWYFNGQFFAECGGADGVYGNNTLKYVNRMLTDFFGAAEADGLVGPKTIARMKEYSKKSPTPPTPPSTDTKVIDVSYSQSAIDWAKAKADGIHGAIIRCGFRHGEGGALDEDEKFMTHIKGAYSAGIPVGIYFFTEAINAAEGREEAQYAIKLWQKAGVPVSYPIGIDSEEVFWENKDGSKGKGRANSDKLSKAKRTEAIKAFAEECARQGYKSMLYASTNWLYNQVDMSILAPHIEVWCAQWSSRCEYTGKYIMWQYTSKGSVAGVKGNADLNHCYITPSPVNPPAPGPEPTPPEDDGHYHGEYPVVKKYLEPGDCGVQVTRLQKYVDWYTDGAFFAECGPADGVYGKNTLKWVNKMLTDFFGAAEADGLVGPKTIAKMKAYTKKSPTPPTPPSGRKYTGPYPTAEEIGTASHAGVIRRTCQWTRDISASGKYRYKQWTRDPNTHKCPICHPGSGDGWNCIGFSFASWRHGGKLASACHCGVIWNGLGDDFINMSNAEVLAACRREIGIQNIALIRNNNRAIPSSALQPGDLLMFYNKDDTYQHMGVYLGGGKIADSTSGRNPNIKSGVSYDSYNKSMPCLFAIRFSGTLTYLQQGDQGVAVTKLQNYLDWFTDGAFFKECGPADGVFGANTDKYVKIMQTVLFSPSEADGTVGPKTISKMQTYEKPLRMGQATGSETGGYEGAAGDQTGKELAICSYSYETSGAYNWHSVFRAKDSSARVVIADACRKACNNDRIGYDTSEPDRKSLYTEAKKTGWQVDKITTNCETTCSELANVCVACAGLKHLSVNENAYVAALESFLSKSADFIKITLDEKALQAGDILVSDDHVAIIV